MPSRIHRVSAHVSPCYRASTDPSHTLNPENQVSIKQRDTEADLAKAEPAVAAAMAALDTLNKKVSARSRLKQYWYDGNNDF